MAGQSIQGGTIILHDFIIVHLKMLILGNSLQSPFDVACRNDFATFQGDDSLQGFRTTTSSIDSD